MITTNCQSTKVTSSGEEKEDKVDRGEFHNQGNAKWIVIRRPLRDHNNTPFGQPAPTRPIGHSGSGLPQGIIGVFQLLLISNTNL
jgi:hypothetical protein